MNVVSEAKSHEEMSKLILQMGGHGGSDEGIAYLGWGGGEPKGNRKPKNGKGTGRNPSHEFETGIPSLA